MGMTRNAWFQLGRLRIWSEQLAALPKFGVQSWQSGSINFMHSLLLDICIATIGKYQQGERSWHTANEQNKSEPVGMVWLNGILAG